MGVGYLIIFFRCQVAIVNVITYQKCVSLYVHLSVYHLGKVAVLL